MRKRFNHEQIVPCNVTSVNHATLRFSLPHSIIMMNKLQMGGNLQWQSRTYTPSNPVEGEIMRDEYDIMNLNPRKNPYAKASKKYLCDCMKNNRHPEVVWNQSVS